VFPWADPHNPGKAEAQSACSDGTVYGTITPVQVRQLLDVARELGRIEEQEDAP
jgi:hypothetical protein